MQKRDIDTVSRRSLLTNLQYLRAVAAYLVVLYHARVLLPASMGSSLEFGRAGVDIFFIISGFIIQHVTSQDNEVRPGQFFVKRAIRVVPFYWALTIAIGVAGLIAPSFAGNGGAPSLSRIIKSILFIPYRDDSGEIHPVLFVGWTLNFEVFFYVVFGAGLFVRDATKRLLLVTGAFVGLAAIGLVTQPRGAALATYTNPLLLEFVAGLWLHTLWRKRLGSRLRDSERVASIGMIAISSLALIGSEALWPQSAQLLKWGLPALIIVFNSLLLERGSARAVWPHALLLGEASYAIYLLHPIVIKVVSVAAGKVRIEHSAFTGLTFLLTFFLVGVVGAAVHVFVERPIIRALRHRLVPYAPRAVASGA